MSDDVTLSHDEARRFYDRFGAKQDSQGFYESAAVDALVHHGEFADARAILELGCGTGSLAARILGSNPGLRYLGLDVSHTMIELARERLAAWPDQAELRETDGAPVLPAPDGSFDRFVSCYVFDLLPNDEMDAVLAEAWRVLEPGGRLCTAGLTEGTSGLSRVVSRGWSWIQRRRPAWVGGCRPVALRPRLAPAAWDIVHCEVVVAFGVPSEVLIATRR